MKKINNSLRCAACGMTFLTPTEYHPTAACESFYSLRNADYVRARLRGIVAYGVAAQRRGVSIDDAMADVNLVTGVEEN